MSTLPLRWRNDHMFLEVEDGLWLLDTGAPTSFGASSTLAFAGEEFQLDNSYFGLTPDTLSGYVGMACAGLLGADVLGRFDFIFDIPGEQVVLSGQPLEHDGVAVPLDSFMGIPVVSPRIRGTAYRMFFDTGAQVGYFQHDSLADFPSAGRIDDFYPGIGSFETETYHVDVQLGGIDFTLRCGALTGLLGATLELAGTQGIIGNQLLRDRRVGYFPRRHLLVL
ncbi:MAG: hypothetical protein Q9Q40_06620 [Acidobacteriota bacterium]|nr:hypothetical protein [Acidobacteriota bacterium]